MLLGTIGKAVVSFLGFVFWQAVGEAAITLPGSYILENINRHTFLLGRKKNIDNNGLAVAVTGVLFWCIVGYFGYRIWQAVVS
ncbi:MAG: hypothetical protein HZC51_12955 [Nitrospirae bacterium]|nr:hypothetical protein [Nitrospirota bacterium]